MVLKDGNKVCRHDCLNDENVHVNAVSLKRAINALAVRDKQILAGACATGADGELEPDIYDCLTQLTNAAFAIQARYGDQLSRSGVKSLKDMIHDQLVALFVQRLDQLDEELAILQNKGFTESVCGELIQWLLSCAVIEDNTLCIFGHKLEFNSHKFNLEDLSEDQLGHISVFPVHELNSSNMLEEPCITDEPLILARELNKSLDIANLPAFSSFREWIAKNYYNHFCSQLMLQLAPKSISPPTNSMTNALSIVVNDRDGARFMASLSRSFKRESSWPLRGSCVLAALMPEYNKGWVADGIPAGQEKALEIRSLIAEKISENIENYLPYVTVIPGFSTLASDASTKLRKDNWVIVEENSDEMKREAILSRCKDILRGDTYLMEPELALLPGIFHKPLWIYKAMAAQFRVERGEIQPHVIYGEDLNENPAYLLDKDEHYEPLSKLS